MRVVNFGSINIDHVYSMQQFVQPGETVASLKYEKFMGGKGCNQSIALAKAGIEVLHAGQVGKDGLWLLEQMSAAGVNTSLVAVSDTAATGHAIIQVEQSGENAIILHGGANQQLSKAAIPQVLQHLHADDVLLVQNEVNHIADLLQQAAAKKVKIFFNPAPMSAEVKNYPLQCVNHLIINQIEGQQLTGNKQPKDILLALRQHYPAINIVLTLGAQGAILDTPEQSYYQAGLKVDCIDATAAGDTFIGYFLAGYLRLLSREQCLHTAVHASALTVTQKGAAASIPSWRQLQTL